MKRTDAQWRPLEGAAPKPGRLLAIVRTGHSPFITRLAAEQSRLSVAHTHRPTLALVGEDGALVSPFGDLITPEGVWWLDLTETLIFDAPRTVPPILPTLAEVKAMRETLEAARDKVDALCAGRETWTMRVPADENRDHDLVIDKALRTFGDLLNALDGTLADEDDLEDRIRCKLWSYPIAYDGQEKAMAKDVMGILRGQS